MEGIEFQYRTQHSKQFVPFEDARYPLSLEERIQQGDRFRRSGEELSAALQDIEAVFSNKTGPHTAQPDCETCLAKKQRIWQAYRNYYLGNEPGRWDTHLEAYRQQIAAMFNSPERYTLKDIDKRSKEELREHLRKDLCSRRLKTSTEFDYDLYQLMQSNESMPMEDNIKLAMTVAATHPHPSETEETARFLRQLHSAITAQERTQVYKGYYCTPSWDDSPQQKNIKVKYERMFDSGLSPDIVISQWKQEALETQKQEISKLKHRLGDLQMAQSAHLKNKAAKKVEQDQRMQDVVQKQTARCNLQSCGREVDLTAEEGVLECAICDWLVAKGQTEGERREHAYYCCEEHVEEDFDDHDHFEHACYMEQHCIFDGRRIQTDTGAGGLCQDCLRSGFISYFCSRACWNSNMELHRKDLHYTQRTEDLSPDLEMFRPEPDLELSPASPSKGWQ